MTTTALVLLAVALVLLPGPARARERVHSVLVRRDAEPVAVPRSPPAWLPWLGALAAGTIATVLASWVVGLVVAGGVAFGLRTWLAASQRVVTDPLALAAAWDLLAACLTAGLPVATAIRAISPVAPEPSATALLRTADLIALGADPVQAWAPALAEASTAELARAARRSARSGTVLAGVAGGLAVRGRAAAADRAEARAQRAAVLITAPLGLCFLPAFFCLAVLPVLLGLAGQLLITW
ncbi:type II secretion system F family protein [Kutzneria albida]|uniref:Putative secreted protein n=1 Tax=Kutzneria albida DSM 43870 TaxID=1449976 RepID=W5W6A4_9PSEU|nr:type II secretion system F family protein [Kutzneria albida]AHH93704.1 putative secreted protein [Kutzneria albida DSM 43870]